MVDPLILGGVAAGIYAILSKEKDSGTKTPITNAVRPGPMPPAPIVEAAKSEIVQAAAPGSVGACVKIEIPKPALPPQPSPVSDLEGLKAWAVKVQQSNAEWSTLQAQAIRSYQTLGWTIHRIVVKYTQITYACPPGTLPIGYQAQVEGLIKTDRCVLIQSPMTAYVATRGSPFPPSAVISELRKRGWIEKRVKQQQSPAQTTPPSPWSSIVGIMAFDNVYLCPPGREP